MIILAQVARTIIINKKASETRQLDETVNSSWLIYMEVGLAKRLRVWNPYQRGMTERQTNRPI